MGTRTYRIEVGYLSDELIVVLIFSHIFVVVKIYVCLRLSNLCIIFNAYGFMGKQTLEYIWNSKEFTSCRPLSRMFVARLIIILRYVLGFVNKTHLLIRRFVFECVSIEFAVFHNYVNDVIIGIRNFYRVCLDVRCHISKSLNYMLKINHEQSTALSNNIILISRVSERIRETCRRKPIR